MSKKDAQELKEILDKGVHIVAGDGDVIDLDDGEPVRVAVVFNVTGFGPHVGAIYAMQLAIGVANVIVRTDHGLEAGAEPRSAGAPSDWA